MSNKHLKLFLEIDLISSSQVIIKIKEVFHRWTKTGPVLGEFKGLILTFPETLLNI